MRNAVVLGLTVLMFCSLASASDNEAATQFATGQALLAKADFAGALAAFKAAATADPKNAEYDAEYRILKRVMNIRTAIAEEKDADAWTQMARALFVYYRDTKLAGEALKLASAMQDKMNNAESAAALADAEVAAGKNAEAAEFLGKLPAEQTTPHTQVLHGLALGRTGKLDAAKAIAARLELPKDCDADICWDAARLYAAVGQSDKAVTGKALATLKCMFECAAPARLATLRADAKAAPEFARLVSTPEFAKALETQPIADACGASCAGCPAAKSGACGAKEGQPGKDAGSGKSAEKGAPCDQHQAETPAKQK